MTTEAKRVEFARFTAGEREAVDRIVDRAMGLFAEARVEKTRMDVEMDLAAVHAHTPLRLGALAAADEFNFAHDIGGIHRHLNRQTGELEDCFLPRFTVPMGRQGPEGS